MEGTYDTDGGGYSNKHDIPLPSFWLLGRVRKIEFILARMDGPKTRTEAKGRDKKKGRDVYSAKHVRIAAAIAEKATQKPKDDKPGSGAKK